MNTRLLYTSLAALSIGGALLAGPVAGMTGVAGTRVATHQATFAQRRTLAGLSLPFIENTGQLDHRVAYYARTFAGTAFVTRNGALVLNLPGRHGRAVGSRGRGWVLSEIPVSVAALRPFGAGRSPTHVSVFHGKDPAHWRKVLKTYAAVDVGRPWPGIDYRVKAHGDNIERVFTLAPGASASAIRMQVRGAKGLSVDDGRLIAHTGDGPVTLSRPVAYQRIRGQRKPVRVAYVLDGERYGFRLGSYDAKHPVIIDPLLQATYLGGTSNNNDTEALAVGTQHIYVAGQTASTNFPGTTGGSQTANAGLHDAYVAELSTDLTTVTQATYFGGSGDDYGVSLAIGGGQVYLAGYTDSTNLPKTTGGAQSSINGGYDAFVAELSADLTTLTQTTYVGGSGSDYETAMVLGGVGQIYLTGYTASTDLPGTTGAAQSSLVSANDAYVAELSPDLKTLTRSTYLGGSGDDDAYALALGSGGQVYVAGGTTSTNLPGTAGGAQPSNAGYTDVFVAELSGDLTALIQSTYLGGTGSEHAAKLAIDSNGAVYVGGSTSSAHLPGTTTGAQPTYAGGTSDAFVAKLSSDLKTLTRATYFGGTGAEYGNGMILGSSGDVYITGTTDSSDLPGTSGGDQPATAGGTDVYVAELPDTLERLTQTTYLGGSASDDTQGALAVVNNHLYVAGSTDSTDFPKTSGGAQGTNQNTVAGMGFVAVYQYLSASSGGGGGGGAPGFIALLALAAAARSAKARRPR